jgi:SAM-dependent methyltransferase
MERRDIILEFAHKDQRGIEIGPYFNPLAPKAAGWHVLSLDVFDDRELRRRAAADPSIPSEMVANIEEVDLLGPAHRIAELVAARGESGPFDFVISSHNFEHLPDPISFLQACSTVLRPGGVLAMAIPDKRCCFDYFRPLSMLPEVLQAWAEKRERPTAAQVLEWFSMHCRLRKDGAESITFSLSDDPCNIVADRAVEEAHKAWRARLSEDADSAPYVDAHCWTFVPSSFRLLLLDLRFLGYVAFELANLRETVGGEFYVHLRNMRGLVPTPLSRDEYYEERQRLLQSVSYELSRNAVSPDEALKREADNYRSLFDASDERITDLECQLEEAQEKFEVAETERQRLHNELEALRFEAGNRKAAAETAEARLVAVLNSTSWRLTAPLRRAVTAVRRR